MSRKLLLQKQIVPLRISPLFAQTQPIRTQPIRTQPQSPSSRPRSNRLLPPIPPQSPSTPLNKTQPQSFVSIQQEKDSNSMWYIPSDCIKKFGNLTIQKMIGSGLQGTVYEACENMKCDKILKVTPLIPKEEKYIELTYVPGISYDVKRKKFEKEVQITQLASDLHISPKVYNAFICSDVLESGSSESKFNLGFIVMDRWDMTLFDYIETVGKLLHQNLYDKLIGLLGKLHEAGVYHGDMHLENVILRVVRGDMGEPIPVDVAIIDYGLADFITPDTKEFADQDLSRLKSKIKRYARIINQNQ